MTALSNANKFGYQNVSEQPQACTDYTIWLGNVFDDRKVQLILGVIGVCFPNLLGFLLRPYCSNN